MNTQNPSKIPYSAGLYAFMRGPLEILRIMPELCMQRLIQLFLNLALIWEKTIKSIIPEEFLQDSKEFFMFLQERLLVTVYRSVIIALAFSYFLMLIQKSIANRINFCCLSLYFIIRFQFVIPSKNLKELKIWACLDFSLLYCINSYAVDCHPNLCNLMNALLFCASCSFINTTPKQITLAICMLLHRTFLNYQKNEAVFESLAILFVFQVFSIFLVKAVTKIMQQYTELLAQTQENAHSDNKSKSMFVASIAHDLKNPISSIMGFIDQLKLSPNLNSEDKSHLMTASYSCQIMNNLIRNIVDLSKIDNLKFDIERLPMNIQEEMKKISQIEEQLSKMKGLQFYTRYLTPIPKLVYGDAMRFSQTMMNLIGNAIKFTTQGYIAVILQWARHVNVEIKNDTFNEDNPNFIPDIDYFRTYPTKRKVSFLGVKKVSSQQVPKSPIPCLPLDLLIDNPEDVNEGLDEPIQYKISKYKEYAEKKGGQTSRFLSVKQSLFESVKTNPSNVSPKLIYREAYKKHYVKSFAVEAPILELNHKEKEEFKIVEPDNKNEDIEQDFGDSGILIIDIIDSGIGMTEEEKKKLFQPFSQANSSIKNQFGGTGLGLWITKQLITLMRGIIEVKSVHQKGSRFRIRIPFKLSKEEPQSTLELLQPKRGRKSANLQNEVAEFRLTECKKFRGRRGSLKSERIILLEDENMKNNNKLSQIYNELKSTDTELIYSSYEKAIDTIEKIGDSVFVIIVIATSHSIKTKKVITKVMKHLQDKDQKPIPFVVASGILIN